VAKLDEKSSRFVLATELMTAQLSSSFVKMSACTCTMPDCKRLLRKAPLSSPKRRRAAVVEELAVVPLSEEELAVVSLSGEEVALVPLSGEEVALVPLSEEELSEEELSEEALAEEALAEEALAEEELSEEALSEEALGAAVVVALEVVALSLAFSAVVEAVSLSAAAVEVLFAEGGIVVVTPGSSPGSSVMLWRVKPRLLTTLYTGMGSCVLRAFSMEDTTAESSMNCVTLVVLMVM
jgi:hypothetical protein